MAIFGSSSPSQDPNSMLRLPAQKRLSLPASHRLTTITEGNNVDRNPQQQPRNVLHQSWNSAQSTLRPSISTRNSSHAASVADTLRTAPPAYDWVPEPFGGVDGEENGRTPVEGEKLAQLRRSGVGHYRSDTRGGWGRLLLILLCVALVAIALGVGLGVGLKKHNADKDSQAGSSDQSGGSTTNSTVTQDFPLGEYSLITALRTADTNCTSNAATWTCYPYTVFSATDASTNTSSLATFNWIVTNTSSVYATSGRTGTTSTEGVPANLTVSSTDNPFSISFSDEPLTYISEANNASSPRYTFSFSMHRAVSPSSAITSDNSASLCYFNQTTFTATMYLDASRTFPGEDLQNSTSIGGYAQWPYAVEVTESSPGGSSVPDCYETVNGVAGAHIINGLTAEPESSTCSCEYRNY